MKMEPSEWWEFSIDIYPSDADGDWIATATWGNHPDEMVTHEWRHPKLSVVSGMVTAFLTARVALVTGKAKERVREHKHINVRQEPLF
jgi:hypothetical protein